MARAAAPSSGPAGGAETGTETETAAGATRGAVLAGASLARQVADWATALRHDGLPGEVAAAARRQIVDTLGICAASSAQDFGQRLAGWARPVAAGGATAVGLDGRYPAEQAALVNGVLAHGLDFDDTYQPGIVHIGAVVVPAALAVAEAEGRGTEEVLTAVVAGYELSSRLGEAAPGEFHRGGYHATPICGAFAAALVGGLLHRLPAADVAAALGIAGSFASGIQEFLRDGSDTKRLHPGWAALAGLHAVGFARAGFGGPQRVFEGDFGLYATHVGAGRFDPAAVTAGLGERWNTLGVSVKPYPCCHLMHAHLDAARELRAQGVRPEQVRRIRARIHQAGLRLLAEPAGEKRRPATPYGAMFSLPYGVAAGLCEPERVDLRSFAPDRLGDPELRRLADLTECVPDPDSAYPVQFDGAVEVELADGRVLAHRVAVTRGSPQRPLGDGELVAKFAGNLAAAGIPAGEAAATGRVLLAGGDLAGAAARLNADLLVQAGRVPG